MNHIATKLFIGFLCMAAVAIGLLWLLQAGLMKNNYRNERVSSVDAGIQQALAQQTADFAGLEERLNARFLLLDAGGAVAYMSPNLPMKGMLLQRLQGSTAIPADGTVNTMTSMMGETEYAVIGRGNAAGGRLYAVFSLADVQKASAILLNQLWIVTAVLVVAAFVLAAGLSGLFSRPVRKITAAAKHMAAGDYATVADVHSADEIGQLAHALNALGEQLQKTETLRRELIANVSHELRSPLAVIQGYAETVRDVTWPQEQKREEQLTMVAEEAARLSRVVEDILDYSKLQAGVTTVSPQPFHAKPALEQIVRLHELAAAEKSTSLQLHCADVQILFDAVKFTQVMDNLINNAVNHAEAGSTIDVAVNAQGAACGISVTNRGETIAPDELPHIWERYYRAKSVSEGRRLGTGLGLAIVKNILEQHSYAYGAESKDGVTTFWFEARKAAQQR